ncbi:MAG: PKD domain-containing protein [Bacteroidales bacterium]|nr:PKD domain-containing protein [Bacteroidales bacterium]
MLKSQYLIAVVLVFFLINPAHSQSWHTYFGDTIWDGISTLGGVHIDGDSFIIGGAFRRIGNDTIKAMARWNDYQWSGFDLSSATNGSPTCFADYKNKLYTGTPYTWEPNGDLGTANFSVWDGTQWLSPNPPIGGGIISLKVINDSLFALGSCEFGAKVLVSDGNSWQYLENIEANYAASIIEYNGELLVGTNYGLWKRTGYDSWQQFSGTPQGWVNAMLVDSVNNFLYTGGSFYYVGDTIESHCIAKYDGFQWYPMQKGVMGDVWRGVMEMYRGDLYFGGFFYATVLDTTRINYVARWDGEKIHSVGGGTFGVVYGLKVFQDTLIVVGNFTYVNVLNGDSIHSKSMVKWYMPPTNDCKYLQPVLHAWQQEGVSEDEFYLVNGQATVNFYNNNAYADSWEWDFGDGISNSTEKCPVHTYNSPGTYNVNVTVTQDQCVKTVQKTITVYLNTNTKQLSTNNYFEVFPNPTKDKANIKCFVPQEINNAEIIILTTNGQVLHNIKLDKGLNNLSIDLSKWKTDIVIINMLFDNERKHSEKLIIRK